MPLTKLLLYIVANIPLLSHYETKLCEKLKKMKRHTVVFFTKTSELHVLNKVFTLQYQHNNNSNTTTTINY